MMRYYVIGKDPKDGHRFCDSTDNLDEAKFFADRMSDLEIQDVVITKEVTADDEYDYYEKFLKEKGVGKVGDLVKIGFLA